MIFIARIFTLFFVTLISFTGVATAEYATGFSVHEDELPIVCRTTISTNTELSVDLVLASRFGFWEIQIEANGKGQVFENYFDDKGMPSPSSLKRAFATIVLGGERINLQNVETNALSQNMVSPQTKGVFSIIGLNNVSLMLSKMPSETVAIPGVFGMGQASDATSAFRACAYRVLQLSPGEVVTEDPRSEYRLIFEQNFGEWGTLLGQEEFCHARRVDRVLIDQMFERASQAFFPGLKNAEVRNRYQVDLSNRLESLELIGAYKARLDGCMLVSTFLDQVSQSMDIALNRALVLE